MMTLERAKAIRAELDMQYATAKAAAGNDVHKFHEILFDSKFAFTPEEYDEAQIVLSVAEAR